MRILGCLHPGLHTQRSGTERFTVVRMSPTAHKKNAWRRGDLWMWRWRSGRSKKPLCSCLTRSRSTTETGLHITTGNGSRTRRWGYVWEEWLLSWPCWSTTSYVRPVVYYTRYSSVKIATPANANAAAPLLSFKKQQQLKTKFPRRHAPLLVRVRIIMPPLPTRPAPWRWLRVQPWWRVPVSLRLSPLRLR